ncbi:hypothetical protein PSTG_13940 [Puccinia striiformis f. sp. tritici PST-78]|uniref:Uncharacterized protein n=1 Tax=Puccinia striiformis f. sp. tritici PST-78 TaxID=1165861 RepID=A0A0L0V063_9BASI|nr:hypothetical protein PSTG_13940 [Puccinia striiformis f. sp. tritici PST-78]
MSTRSLHCSSTYSLESTRAHSEVQLSRQRSLTLDSAAGSSVETVTGRKLTACDDEYARIQHITPPEEPHSCFVNFRNDTDSHINMLVINQQPPTASARAELPNLPAHFRQAAGRDTVSPGLCEATSSSMMSGTALRSDESDDGHVGLAPLPLVQPAANPDTPPRRSVFPERKPSISASEDSDHETPSPLQFRPKLTHHSPPPWSMDGLEETCADGSVGSGCSSSLRSDGGLAQTVAISSDHQSYPRHQCKTVTKRLSTSSGLGKLFTSVKASLQLLQGSQQGWPSSDQTNCSLKSVEADSRTALANEEFNTTVAREQEGSNNPVPRRVSFCSNSTTDSATTSTSHSTSITPSSSLFSLPAVEPDSPITSIPGRPHDLIGDGDKIDSKDQYFPLINPLCADQPQNPLHNSLPNMSTQTAYSHHSPAPASCFGNSYVNNNTRGKRDHPKLKLKASFGFLNNLKRAVGGVDHSLSFSFHNNSSTFLTTNTISLPFGTVLRNNGLDPLPHCHPLPLKPSQSSPASLNYPSSLPSRLEQASHFAPAAHPIALSSSTPDFSDERRYGNLPALSPHSPRSQRRPDESPVHPPQSQCNTDEALNHPPKSPSIVPDDAPTLNLRPVSVPFAAGFSERFLLADLHSADSSPEGRNLVNARKKHSQGTDHEDHCTCCSPLASENAILKNRVKELELHIYRSQASKLKTAHQSNR